jgi:hypothetical protein
MCTGEVDDEFWDLYMPEPNCGCWLWLGEMAKEKPCVKIGEVTRMADELFYERRFGTIDATEALHHSCGLSCCVNPDHMMACRVQ